MLIYLSKGFTIKETAILTGIKWFAVNEHIKSIYRKLFRGPNDDGALANFCAPKPLGGGPQTVE